MDELYFRISGELKDTFVSDNREPEYEAFKKQLLAKDAFGRQCVSQCSEWKVNKSVAQSISRLYSLSHR